MSGESASFSSPFFSSFSLDPEDFVFFFFLPEPLLDEMVLPEEELRPFFFFFFLERLRDRDLELFEELRLLLREDTLRLTLEASSAASPPGNG